MAAAGNRSIDGAAANAEARTHCVACVQGPILGSARRHTSALARRKAWFVEQ